MTWLSCWARMFSAAASTAVRGSVSEWTARIMIGASAGLVLRSVGGLGMSFGSCPAAALMASSTSVAAPSMLRLRSNWRVIWLLPRTLTEVICVRPGIWPNWVSSGVATAVAMVLGLAPGYWPVTLMVGNSTAGSGATGRKG